MSNDIKKITESMVDETVENIQKLVRVGSVRNLEDSAPGAPFGRGIRKNLDMVMEICGSIGMRTFIAEDGLYGYAEIGDVNSAEMIGIVGHLDVVPTGEDSQWTKGAPFSGDIVDNMIIGRGTLDDKGPMMVNIMAVKALVEAGVEFNKRVRFIFGTAEETTWEGINAYKANEEAPTVAYSPDADFPVIHAEKSIIRGDVKHFNEGLDFSLIAKGAYNAVNDRAIYKGSKVKEICAEMDKLGYKYEVVSETELHSIGKNAHAMQCFQGINAITRIATAMANVGETCPSIEFLGKVIGEDCYGVSIFGKKEEEVSGFLTLNIGFCHIEGTTEHFGIDSRVPVLFDEEEILATFEARVNKEGLTVERADITPKLYLPVDSPLVSTLLKVYQDVTGDVESKPLTTGGGTYARAFDNCVAFGTVLHKQGMVDLMHQPNENFQIEFIQPSLEIYANAIKALLEQ